MLKELRNVATALLLAASPAQAEDQDRITVPSIIGGCSSDGYSIRVVLLTDFTLNSSNSPAAIKAAIKASKRADIAFEKAIENTSRKDILSRTPEADKFINFIDIQLPNLASEFERTLIKLAPEVIIDSSFKFQVIESSDEPNTDDCGWQIRRSI